MYIYIHHVFLSAIQFSILPLPGITWCFQIFSHGVITGLGDPHGRLHQLIGAPESPTGWGPCSVGACFKEKNFHRQICLIC